MCLYVCCYYLDGSGFWIGWERQIIFLPAVEFCLEVFFFLLYMSRLTPHFRTHYYTDVSTDNRRCCKAKPMAIGSQGVTWIKRVGFLWGTNGGDGTKVPKYLGLFIVVLLIIYSAVRKLLKSIVLFFLDINKWLRTLKLLPSLVIKTRLWLSTSKFKNFGIVSPSMWQ